MTQAPPGETGTLLHLGGEALRLDPAGGVFAPQRGVLVVADLHLGKAATFARTGQFLPPQDGIDTLDRLFDLVVRRGAVETVLLGDTFHRAGGEADLLPSERSRLEAVAARTRLVFVSGNHDPDESDPFGGPTFADWRLGAIRLSHEPLAESGPQIFGHFHPAARLATRAGTQRRRCFLAGSERLCLPAFGAFAGGIDPSEPALRALFPETGSDAHLLAGGDVHRVPVSALAGRRVNRVGR